MTKNQKENKIHVKAPNVVVEWLIHLIREVPGSNLIPETGCPDSGFLGFPQSLKVNAGMVP
jgi:hypothetical protein